jgi:hypothetical protein
MTNSRLAALACAGALLLGSVSCTKEQPAEPPAEPVPKSVLQASEEAKRKLVCLNNMRQIGGLLITLQAGRGWKTYSGAKFVLQVARFVDDEDLEIFICPGEPEDPANPRPEPGSPEFTEMYRTMDLEGEIDPRLTSYAGPNWKDFPRVLGKELPRETRLLICDRCRDGRPHHQGGICVTYENSKVAFLGWDELEGHDQEVGTILVGPESPDERLSKMLFIGE